MAHKHCAMNSERLWYRYLLVPRTTEATILRLTTKARTNMVHAFGLLCFHKLSAITNRNDVTVQTSMTPPLPRSPSLSPLKLFLHDRTIARSKVERVIFYERNATISKKMEYLNFFVDERKIERSIKLLRSRITRSKALVSL